MHLRGFWKGISCHWTSQLPSSSSRLQLWVVTDCWTVLPRLSVPRLSETSIIRTQVRTWSLLKNMVFSLKSQTLRLVRVHVFVCHTYMFNVGTQWYVIVYSVKCKGLQMRPSYIFLCYNSMYIARKVSFGLSERFHLSEQPIKPLCPKVFG